MATVPEVDVVATNSGSRFLIRISLTLILFFQIKRTAIAKTNLEIQLNTLWQKNHSGRQVFDGSGNENLTVYEPVLFVDQKINSTTNLFASVPIDLWTSASENIFDTTSGASGRAVASSPVLQNRYAFDIGVSKKWGKFVLTPRFGYSSEFDYRSINGGLTLQKSFKEDNVTLSLGYQFLGDSVRRFDIPSSQFIGWESKKTQSIDLSVSQILGPSDLILIGYSFTSQRGLLSNSINSVDLAGTRVNESLPRKRDRQSGTLRYVHGFTDNLAFHFNYRFYFDNWGIISQTIEPSVYMTFFDEAFLVRPFYRFYHQPAADYYQSSFSTIQLYMTSDSDLARFSANELGLECSYTWDLKGFVKSIELGGAALYYFRTNGLKIGVFQSALNVGF